MKPYGREKTVKGRTYKTDCRPKRFKALNWWENICDFLSRTTLKHRWKKEIEKELS